MVWAADMSVALRIEGAYRMKEVMRVKKLRQLSKERASKDLCYRCDTKIITDDEKKEAEYKGGLICKSCREKGYQIE